MIEVYGYVISIVSIIATATATTTLPTQYITPTPLPNLSFCPLSASMIAVDPTRHVAATKSFASLYPGSPRSGVFTSKNLILVIVPLSITNLGYRHLLYKLQGPVVFPLIILKSVVVVVVVVLVGIVAVEAVIVVVTASATVIVFIKNPNRRITAIYAAVAITIIKSLILDIFFVTSTTVTVIVLVFDFDVGAD